MTTAPAGLEGQTFEQLERALSDRTLSRDELEATLDADFQEVGASGQIWSRTETIEVLTAPAKQPAPRVVLESFDTRELAPGVVTVRYRATRDGSISLRTSIWRADPSGRWRLVLHQGTQAPNTSKPPWSPPPRMKRQLTRPLTRLAFVVALSAPIALAGIGVLPHQAFINAGRVALIFVVLMVAFRLLGKRELNSFSSFELVTLMLIPEVLSNALQQTGALAISLVGLSTLLWMVLVTSLLAHRFGWFSRLTESEPTLLVVDGRVREREMNEERIQMDELLGEMRARGIESLERVKWAILESGGSISFIAREDARPPS